MTADHAHNWIQFQLTLFPGPTKERPIVGARVLYRCARRGCGALYATDHLFRRPARTRAPNLFKTDYRNEDSITYKD